MGRGGRIPPAALAPRDRYGSAARDCAFRGTEAILMQSGMAMLGPRAPWNGAGQSTAGLEKRNVHGWPGGFGVDPKLALVCWIVGEKPWLGDWVAIPLTA